MYKNLSNKITMSLIHRGIISSTDKVVYEYSIEVFLSDTVYWIIAVVTALLTNSILSSISFYFGFLVMRKYAGGYHAKTYKMCHILFWINQILMIFLDKLLLYTTSFKVVSYIFIIISSILIFSFSPVENVNKPFSDKERKRYYIMSRIIMVISSAVVIALGFSNINFRFICMFTFGIFSVSISLMAESIKNIKKE